MKTGLLIALVVGLIGLGLLTYLEHIKYVGAKEAAEELADSLTLVREEAIAQVERVQAAADSAAEEALAQEEARLAAQQQIEAHAQELRARGDSLAEAITDLVPIELVGEQVAEQVAVAVGSLRESYEGIISGKDDQIEMAESMIDTLRRQVVLEQSAKESLQVALDAAIQETNAWKSVANPSFFARVWKEKGPLSAALTLGVGIGAAFGG